MYSWTIIVLRTSDHSINDTFASHKLFSLGTDFFKKASKKWFCFYKLNLGCTGMNSSSSQDHGKFFEIQIVRGVLNDLKRPHDAIWTHLRSAAIMNLYVLIRLFNILNTFLYYLVIGISIIFQSPKIVTMILSSSSALF